MRFRLLALLVLLAPMLILQQATLPVEAASPRATAVQAGVPFSDGFEQLSLGADWTPQISGSGVVELTTGYFSSGSQSVFLGQKVGDSASASLILALDLTGQSDVFLDFWLRATGVSESRQVYISDNDGTSWTQIANLDEVSQGFSHIVIDLATEAATKGLVLNSNFRVRFSYFDYLGGDAGDGFVIDDLQFSTSDPVSRAYVPFVRR